MSIVASNSARISQRIMIFIDGANLYHNSVRYSKTHKKNDWQIDISALVNFIRQDRQLVRTYYFGATPESPSAGQTKFFDKLRHEEIVVITRPLHYSPSGQPFEKGVDVALVTMLLKMAYQRAFDIGVIVSGDADYVEAAKSVMDQGLRIEVFSFREGLSQDLHNNCDKLTLIDDFADRIEYKKQTGQSL